MPTTIQALQLELRAETSRLRAEMKRAADRTERSMRRMEKSTDRQTRAQNRNAASARRQGQQLLDTSRKAARASMSFQRLTRAIAGVYIARQFAAMTIDLANAADQVRLLESRLNAVSGSSRGLRDVLEVSQELGSGLVDTGALFTKLAVGTKELGASSEEIASVSRAVLQLGRVSGLTFAEVNYFSRQLAQGLGSGLFAGDELRSVRENMPVVAQQLARALTEMEAFGAGVRVSAGDLKALGKQGVLTADVVWRALKFIADSGISDELFEALPDTFEQAANRIRDQWQLLIDSLANNLGRAKFYGDIIGIADVFKEMRMIVANQGWEELGEFIGLGIELGLTKWLRNKLKDKGLADLYLGLFGMAGAGDRDSIAEFLFGGYLDDMIDATRSKMMEISATVDANHIDWSSYFTLDELADTEDKIAARLGQLDRIIEENKARIQSDRPVIQDAGRSGLAAAIREQDALVERYAELRNKARLLNAAAEKESLAETVTGISAEDLKAARKDFEREFNATNQMIEDAIAFAQSGGERGALSGRVIRSVRPNLADASGGGLNAAVDAERDARLAEKYREDLKKYNEEVLAFEKEKYRQMEGFARSAANSIQSSFADFLFDPFEDGLKGMLKQFIDVIRRMIAEMVAFQILSGIPGIGSFFTGPAPTAPTAPAKPPGLASGGRLSAGTMALVGEKGPELFRPDVNGTVIPNHAIGNMGMGGTAQMFNITQNIDARGNDDPSKILAMMPSFADAIKRDIRDEMSRGRM